jgi:hypothetical protein
VIRDTAHWARSVLRSPLNLLAGGVAALATLALVVWLPNLGLVWTELIASDLSPSRRISFAWSTLGGLLTAISPAAAVVSVILATLVGLNVAASVTLLRQRSGSGAAGVGVAGTSLALLGVGCSACGVGILGSLLGAGTAAAVVAALPFGGLEFGLAGIALLVGAFAVTARRALQPVACEVEVADA